MIDEDQHFLLWQYFCINGHGTYYTIDSFFARPGKAATLSFEHLSQDIFYFIDAIFMVIG